MGLCLLLILAGCNGEATRKSVGTPNIIVITLDTLRGDRLGCYGYERNTTPRLDEFAQQATLFEHAQSTAPWTLPSHASMFTGLYPFEHGSRTYWTGTHDSDRPAEQTGASLANNAKPLGEEFTTLAESLHANGYRTGAVVANTAYLTRKFQLQQGLEAYRVRREHYDGVNARVFEWLEDADERPFFLFVNYMDTHIPYNNTPVEGFLDPPARGESGAILSHLAPLVLTYKPVPPHRMQMLVDLYDTGVRNVDLGAGLLLDYLQAHGLYDDTVILITSDHGEFFGEHDLIEHSKDVYEEVVGIPFILKDVGQSSAVRESQRVSLVHVPWILAQRTDALDEDDYPYSWPSPFLLAENHYARAHSLKGPGGKRFHRSRIALYEGSHKYIHSSDAELELYDLVADPRELQNLFDSEVAQRERMANTLGTFLTQRIGGLEAFGKGELTVDEQTLTPEEIERLKSLGYF